MRRPDCSLKLQVGRSHRHRIFNVKPVDQQLSCKMFIHSGALEDQLAGQLKLHEESRNLDMNTMNRLYQEEGRQTISPGNILLSQLTSSSIFQVPQQCGAALATVESTRSVTNTTTIVVVAVLRTCLALVLSPRSANASTPLPWICAPARGASLTLLLRLLGLRRCRRRHSYKSTLSRLAIYTRIGIWAMFINGQRDQRRVRAFRSLAGWRRAWLGSRRGRL